MVCTGLQLKTFMCEILLIARRSLCQIDFNTVVYTNKVGGRGGGSGGVFSSRVSGRGYKTCPVCQSALMAKPFDLGSRNLAQGLTSMKSQPNLMVKVIGQGRQVEKRDFLSFRWVVLCISIQE